MQAQYAFASAQLETHFRATNHQKAMRKRYHNVEGLFTHTLMPVTSLFDGGRLTWKALMSAPACRGDLQSWAAKRATGSGANENRAGDPRTGCDTAAWLSDDWRSRAYAHVMRRLRPCPQVAVRARGAVAAQRRGGATSHLCACIRAGSANERTALNSERRSCAFALFVDVRARIAMCRNSSRQTSRRECAANARTTLCMQHAARARYSHRGRM